MASSAAQAIAEKHNAGISKTHNTDPSGTVKSFADRLNNLIDEKETNAEDIRELKAEAKEAGVDPKALAAVVKQQREDAEQRAKRLAHEEVVDQYRAALSLLD